MRRRSFLQALLAGAAFRSTSSATPQQSSQPNQQKIQALIITGQNRHDWRGTTPLLRKFLEDTGRFEVRVTEEFRDAGPGTLEPYDVAIVNYYDSRRPELRWGERTEKAFVDFVRSGKGVVIYHFSLAAFDGWEEYEQMCGANWRPGHGQHSPPHDFKVEIRDREHPITRGLKDFIQRKDELYANLKWQAKGTYHVLAEAWDDYSLYKNPRQPISGPGKYEPLLWVVPYGKGRVFVTALGHDPAAIQQPGFIATFVRGAEWAATGTVTIPLPEELRL